MGLLILFAFGLALVIAVGTLAALRYITRPPRITYGIAVARRLPGCPADIGLDYEEREFHFRDRTHTRVFDIRGAAANGPVVIVSHAWGESRYDVQYLLPLLVPHASRVLLYDLRGHGENSAARSLLGTREVDDLVELVEAMVPRGARIVLTGRSLGAGISIAAGAKLGERVAGVLGESAFRHTMEPIAAKLRELGYPRFPFELLIDRHLAFWFQSRKAYDRATHAAKLTAPLLLLHGERDRYCPSASAQAIASAAKRGEVVVFEEGRYLDNRPANEAMYDAAIRVFFERISG